MTERRPRKLRIGKDFSLPFDAVTQTLAILAKRGAGKTYTASVHAEEMLKAKAHVIIIDPTGAWWGLRATRDGGPSEFQVPILGGEHKDLPLEPGAGETIANFVIDNRISVVLDLELFRKNEQKRFVMDFLETLYRRNRDPVHLFLDEADAFAPQRPMHGDERMLGSVEDIVRRGRKKGIGVTLITQRSAVLNKNVLTQAEILVALRTIAPQDQEAVEAWIKVHGTPEQKETMMASLASLPLGTAWYWAPGWPEGTDGIFQQVHVRERETFNSSATPKPGETRREPKTLADVDLGQLQTAIASTIEKAKQEDPKELRKQIAQLKLDVKRKTAPIAIADSRISKAAIEEATRPIREELRGAQKDLMRFMSAIHRSQEAMRVAREDLQDVLDSVSRDHVGRRQTELPITTGERPGPAVRKDPPMGSTPHTPSIPRPLHERDGLLDDAPANLKLGARRMLEVLVAWHPDTRNRAQIATLAGLSPNSGTYSDYLSKLRTSGFIAERGDKIVATKAGMDFVHEYGPHVRPVPLTHDEIMDVWNPKLKLGARRMLAVLVGEWPKGIARSDLGLRAEIEPTSGTFSDYLSMLRRNGLAEDKDGEVVASDTLFPGGSS